MLYLPEQFYRCYLAFWLVSTSIVVAKLVKERKRISWREYVRFLCVPWKLMLFVPALLFVTFAGRFTDDETWDVTTGFGMAMLTFLTAPLSIGFVYKAIRRQLPLAFIFCAFVLCLFSSSWYYDGWLLMRDGHYTSRWLSNLLLSPIIYVSAGLLWNLEVFDKTKIRLSFLRMDWPAPPTDRSFRPLFLVSIPIVLIAAAVLTGFVSWHF